MSKKIKQPNSGQVRVDLIDIEYESFSDMSYFEKWVPEGCRLVNVTIGHEVGYYDEGDQAWFWINWERIAD